MKYQVLAASVKLKNDIIDKIYRSTEDSSSFFKIIFKPKAQSDECLPEDSCF